MDLNEQIKTEADWVIETFPKEHLGYNEASVKWLDRFIEKRHLMYNAEKDQPLIWKLGYFFGECIRQEFGGYWEDHPVGLAIVFTENYAVFPVNKVNKQFRDGCDAGESVLNFYQNIRR